MADRYFTQASFNFLTQLAKNNHRDWFNENKKAYETSVRTPALHFIEDMARPLAKISTHFTAIPKKVGGSLMRVHRDVRFGKDKRPYKTNIGIQFRHERGKDVHAPGFYVHIEPKGCFIGVGIWRPDSPSLTKIRDAIVDNEKSWVKASRGSAFRTHYSVAGESLQRPPRGFDKDHPLIEDLKRKDFICIAEIKDKQVLSDAFPKLVSDHFQVAKRYMDFLCFALDLEF